MNVVVAGAGNVGRHLAVELVVRGHQVTIIEQSDAAIAKIGSERLRVVRGDACAPHVLERADVRDADVVVAVTGDDEDNLVVSLLAKEEFAVPRVVARINYPSNEWLFDEAWGVDLAVSPPHLLTSLVEEEVLTGDLISLLKLQRGEIELLEVRLEARSAAVGRRIDQLALPPDATLVAVVRGGHVLPARGTTPLTEGDEVLALVAGGDMAPLRACLIGPNEGGDDRSGHDGAAGSRGDQRAREPGADGADRQGGDRHDGDRHDGDRQGRDRQGRDRQGRDRQEGERAGGSA